MVSLTDVPHIFGLLLDPIATYHWLAQSFIKSTDMIYFDNFSFLLFTAASIFCPTPYRTGFCN